MKQKLENCHQLEWVRGYLDSAIHRNNVASLFSLTDEDRQFFEGSRYALQVLLKAINDTFEGGD